MKTGNGRSPFSGSWNGRVASRGACWTRTSDTSTSFDSALTVGSSPRTGFGPGGLRSSRDRRLATAGRDGISLWDVATAQATHRLGLPAGGWSSALDFSADGRRIVAGVNSGENAFLGLGTLGHLAVWRLDGPDGKPPLRTDDI